MKRSLLISLGCIAATMAANAQVARWVFQPAYDSFEISADQKYLVTDSANVSTLWTLDGKKVYSTPEKIAPFADGYAVITGRADGQIAGFIDEAGNFTALDGGEAPYDYPYFSDGLLLFEKDGEYGYYKNDGSEAGFAKTERAYPFHNGYAPQYGYAQTLIRIKKVPCFYYINDAGGHIAFALGDKMVEEKDISFVSNIPESGKGIVVVKGKVYWFDSAEGVLDPMYLGDGDDRSEQATVDKKLIQQFEEPSDGIITVKANYGNGKVARFHFDEDLMPIDYVLDGETITLSEPKAEAAAMASSLSRDGQSAPYGIAYKGAPLIAPQYQEVAATFGDNAIVKINDKWGMVRLTAVPVVTARLNDNHKLGFRHHDAKSHLAISLPAAFPAEGLAVVPDSASGMVLNEASRQNINGSNGNVVKYDVTLNIPEGLSSEATKVSYPMRLTYDGAELPADTVSVEAWYANSYTVDPLDFGTRIDNGNVTVAFDVNQPVAYGDINYPFDVRVIVGQAVLVPARISETRYKITLPGVPAGMHHVDIAVIEDGCPAQVFPFDLKYNPGDVANQVAPSAELLLADPLPEFPAQPQYANQMPPYAQQQYAQPVQQIIPQQQYAQPVQQPVPQQQYAQPVQQYQPVQTQSIPAQPAQQQAASMWNAAQPATTQQTAYMW